MHNGIINGGGLTDRDEAAKTEENLIEYKIGGADEITGGRVSALFRQSNII
jgi:hypothetical protein